MVHQYVLSYVMPLKSLKRMEIGDTLEAFVSGLKQC